jgi:hypothetical protein
MLALNEKEALNILRPKGVQDRNIHPILLSLYWQMKEENLDSTIDSLSRFRTSLLAFSFICSGTFPTQQYLIHL